MTENLESIFFIVVGFNMLVTSIVVCLLGFLLMVLELYIYDEILCFILYIIIILSIGTGHRESYQIYHCFSCWDDASIFIYMVWKSSNGQGKNWQICWKIEYQISNVIIFCFDYIFKTCI